MRLQVAGALLLLSFGAFAAGCGSGVYGSAATFETPGSSPPPPPSSSSAPVDTLNLLGNDEAVANWTPNGPVKVAPIGPDRGSRTIRVHWIKAPRGQDLGAGVVIVSHPVKGAKYRFEVWVRGSSKLVGKRLAVSIGVPDGAVGTLRTRVTSGWQQHSVQGRATAKDSQLRGLVYVPHWYTKPDSWLEIAGAIRQQLTAGSQ